jgi:hypothetical protein
MASGLAFLRGLHLVMEARSPALSAALSKHSRRWRPEIEERFSLRSKANYEAELGGRAGGSYDPDLLREGECLVRGAESPEDLLVLVAPAHYLSLLAFLIPPEKYLRQEEGYRRLARDLRETLGAIPALRDAAAARVIRLLAEDMMDSPSASLAESGKDLLGTLDR